MIQMSYIKNFYYKYEKHISSISLVLGFVWNAIFLKRVDLFWENFWVILHLLIVGICIILINKFENQQKLGTFSVSKAKIHFWLVTIMQFTFGGILSTYLVFYFRSSALSVTWPFLVLLAVAFVANERFKNHYHKLNFQISIFYLAIFSFTIFFVPVLVKKISDMVFLFSGVISLVLIWLFLRLLKKFAKERLGENLKILLATIFGIFFTINILYFFNLIPPIPIALKDGGVYHNISKNTLGQYLLEDEERNWLSYFNPRDTLHILSSDSLYAYSAVFSPASFRTDIVHEWQYYSNVTKSWVTASIVPLSTNGGREDGYRTYSKKSNLTEGKWRVNVKTKSGQIIGRLRFDIIFVDNLPLIHEVQE